MRAQLRSSWVVRQQRTSCNISMLVSFLTLTTNFLSFLIFFLSFFKIWWQRSLMRWFMFLWYQPRPHLRWRSVPMRQQRVKNKLKTKNKKQFYLFFFYFAQTRFIWSLMQPRLPMQRWIGFDVHQRFMPLQQNHIVSQFDFIYIFLLWLLYFYLFKFVGYW